MKSITKLITFMTFFVSVTLGVNPSIKASLSDLPPDMKAEVLIAIAKSQDINEAAESLRAVAVSSKGLNAVVNNARLTEILLSILANRFTGGDKYKAALALRTKGAEPYIQQEINNMIAKMNSIQTLIDSKESYQNVAEAWSKVAEEMQRMTDEIWSLKKGYDFRTPIYQKVRTWIKGLNDVYFEIAGAVGDYREKHFQQQ